MTGYEMIQEAFDRLQNLKYQRPVIIAPNGLKEIYEKFWREYTVIEASAVPKDVVYVIVDEELREHINRAIEENEK